MIDESDIKKRVNDAVDDFTYQLLTIKNTCGERQKDIEVELELSKKLNIDLKSQIEENNKRHKEVQEKLQLEINNSKDLQQQLEDEIRTVRSQQDKQKKLRFDLEETFKNAEAERSLAVENRKRLDDEIKTYKDKTQSLTADFDLLAKRMKQMEQDEIRIKLKDKELIKREEKVIQDNSNISIREIELKKKQQNLELEIKREKVNV